MLGEGCETATTRGAEQKSLVTVSFSWWCITWMLLLLLFLHVCTGLAQLKRAGRKDMVKSLHKQPVIWKIFAEI